MVMRTESATSPPAIRVKRFDADPHQADAFWSEASADQQTCNLAKPQHNFEVFSKYVRILKIESKRLH